MKEPNLLKALYEISRSMHTLNLEELLHLILQGVTQTLGFDRAKLYLYNPELQSLELKMSVGKKSGAAEPEKNVTVPLMARDKKLGEITAYSQHGEKEISGEALDALEMFAHEAGIAVDNAALYQKLENRSFALADQVFSASKNLNKTMKTLERAAKLAAMGQLAAGIAHEIRNPLTSIKILVHSIAQNGHNPEKSKKDLSVITQEIERLEKIVREFLAFGRLPEPRLETVDVCDVLESTRLLLQHELKKRQTRYIARYPSDGARVVADREQLGQVFFNLIQNSLEAIEGEGIIEADVAIEGKYVVTRISDNVPGIAKEIREKLFEPFTTTKEEGTGLGLSIVHRIVDHFGGKIKAQSKEGKGATFVVSLPA